MSDIQSAQHILALANEKEKEFDWLGALDSYKKALEHVLRQEDFLKAGEIEERIGYCLFRVAFQAETRDEFKSRMKLAADLFEKGAETFEKVGEAGGLAEIKHCGAMVAYVNSWLATDLSVKREQLDECWRLEKEALKLYEKASDQMNVGKTCNNLLTFLIERLKIEWDAESREKIIEEALEYGEKARKVFSEAQDRSQLALAYTLTAFFCRNAAFSRELNAERREECREEAISYPQKAIEISEEIGDAYLIGLSNLCLADARLDIVASTGLQEREHYEKALQCGSLTKDNRIIADALFGLEFATNFSVVTQEDPDEAREEFRKLDKYWEDAVRHYSLVANNSGIAMAYSQLLITTEQRSGIETDLENKRLLLEKSVELGYRGLDHARLSGSIDVTFHITRSLSVPIFCLARIEADMNRKRSLLEESSAHIEKAIDILKQASAVSLVEPKEVNLAFIIWSLAMNQVELANIETNVDGKTKMLEKAITNMRSAREYWLKWVKSQGGRVEEPLWVVVGENEMKTGKALNQLYALTGDNIFLKDSLEAFELSVDANDKANLPSRVAEAYWQIAKTYNQLVEYVESAKNFESASKSYRLATEKIPQLKEFYMDYATYMQAWSEIEQARHYHARQEYGQAKKHYEKTAQLHASSKSWKYLAANYLAWTQLEHGEEQSRREQSREAIQAFRKADGLFREAKRTLRIELDKVENADERDLIRSLIKASDMRREYCLGRIALEKAKVLDRQGDHAGSSRKYGSAAEKFQKVIDITEHESDRQELRPVVCLCQAWQMMTRAEAEVSPDLYKEASELFKEAKDRSLNEKAKMLALGHSQFCKALEAGTRFEATRDTTLYSAATKHLESAANYYVKAGFETASEYAKATQLLFDAYVYMYDAKRKTDPEKRARYYIMAEKVLRTSAGSYLKAKHPEKSEQVQRLLEKVREERELASSLSEVLHAPTITSSTASFTTPTPSEERAVGLERFEHAVVQANLILHAKEIMVGEDLSVEVEVVNAGKGPAFLTKVEELFPENFELIERPEIYRVEDGYLNMKGKMLGPLEAEDVKLVLRPLNKGVFSLKPRIEYLDETGKHRSHEPEPVRITVKELGIFGWIKGGRK